ncbi:MAG: sulfatase-like hydrolase/transferase [Bacteroidota bacterium]
MKQIFHSFLKFFAFWLALFLFQQVFFLLYFNNQLSGIPASLILRSFYQSVGMNLSAAAYLTTLPFILSCIGFFSNKKIWIKISNIFMLVLTAIVILIGLGDLGLYSSWGSKINAKAVSYMLFPDEAVQSFSAVPVWLFILVFILEFAAFFLLFKKVFRFTLKPVRARIQNIIIAVLLLAILPVMYRGGFQKYPMNKSWVYYSKYDVLNYSALNGFWNFIEILSKPVLTKNPYIYMDNASAKGIVREMNSVKCDSTFYILNQPRPNIILILLESASAENMTTLGGKEKIMPGLDSLTHEGLLFNRFYATGFRTEQGLISFISGFPAQPTVSVLRNFGKFEKLPNIGKTLDGQHYSLNYYYSGKLEFANTRSYLNASGFTKLLGKDSRKWKRTTQWGAYDEELFNCHLNEAATDKSPFFSILMTSTSHEPFDADVPQVFSNDNDAGKYKNTIRYTDGCVFQYIQKAKKTNWYKNTLFIITSDHAHSYPQSRSKNDYIRHHIPLLLLGGALKPEYSDKIISSVGSQTDFAASLLQQLRINSKGFPYSKNLFNPCGPHYAFYAFDNGFGIITDDQVIVYDHNSKQVIFQKNNCTPQRNEKILNMGKAMLQVVFQEYIDL